ASAGFETHLVAPATRSYSKRGVIIHGVHQKKEGRFWRMIEAGSRTFSRAKALNAKIYHLHDPELLPYGILLKAAGKKVVYDVHEDVPRDIESKPWIPKLMRRMVGTLFEHFENSIASHLSAVVAATPFIRKRFSKINAVTCTVNNYPIIGELLTADAFSDFSASARPYVCYAGGISAIRGLREMIAAISIIDSPLLLAGVFSHDNLHRDSMKLPGWKQVEYLGQVARRELALMLNRSFAGLVLYHPEANHINSQPTKMFEYMSAGLPVIVSDFPLWRDIVQRIGCGICVNPFDTEEIAKAIRFLDRNRNLAKSMGEKGLSAVSKEFNWQREQAVLINLYKTLLSS
ncbi:glycosyltransferase, partial [bacterium]|nr:glycosyltransferase [bacterium]